MRMYQSPTYGQVGRKAGIAGTAAAAFPQRARAAFTAPPSRRRSTQAGIARSGGALVLLLVASGCLEVGRPGLAIDIPGSYRAAQGSPEAATPALDWWRSFRSRELTSLMEEALTANFDIAVAMAQISQAD